MLYVRKVHCTSEKSLTTVSGPCSKSDGLQPPNTDALRPLIPSRQLSAAFLPHSLCLGFASIASRMRCTSARL